MCGIAGLISRPGDPLDRTVLERMVGAVAHRGPDGDGVFVDRNVGLGSRRLAILDLSENGAQPMRSAVSDKVIVYNGEIYNYRELRTELIEGGYPFRSRTDTEVILAAYERWGEGCVQRFNGMWAFAIYDPKEEMVFCSRDRFGIKPFYYVDRARFFAFGSEIRQLLPLLETRTASRSALTDSLCFRASERGAETFFAEVYRLEAGHSFRYRVADHRLEMARYYRIQRSDGLDTMSPDEASETFRDLLTDAVRLRLRSDVPVGTCLSGGLDSSSVASLAADLRRQDGSSRFSAITAVSEDRRTDESGYAKAVVHHANLDWHPIQPDYDLFADTLQEVVRAQEEPFGSPSICMQFLVMRESKRQGLPVLLDGQGGDEILLGYDRYSVPFIKDVYKRDGLRAAVLTMSELAQNNRNLGFARQLKLLGYFSFPRVQWFTYRYRLGKMHSFPPLAYFQRLRDLTTSDLFEIQRHDIEREVLPSLLRYEDKNAMWHSVETRLPFLDYRLVEFALNLPARMKIMRGWTKHVLRQAMESVLPESVVWRKDKLGFEAPDALWLPRLRATMIGQIEKSSLLSALFGSSSRSLRVAHLSLATLWRLHVVALWELEFGVSGLTDEGYA